MSETPTKKGFSVGELVSRIIAIVIGWAILTMVNMLPLWLECPLVEKLKISGGYDVNIIEEHTFDVGLFSKRLAETGNFSNGAQLIYNDKAAYFTLNDVVCELDLEKMETRDLEGKAKAEPHFCDDEVYLSTAYLDEIAVGKLGDGSPQSFDKTWFNDIEAYEKNSSRNYPLYKLLKKGDTEELSAYEMAQLVGFTIHGDLVGWDGENAWFRRDDEMSDRIIFQKHNEKGIVDVIPGSCSNPGNAMVTGNTAIYSDGKLLKTLNLDTFEEKVVNDEAHPVVFFNHMSINGYRILVWISTDGMHTLDLDNGNTNFVEGNWYSDYRGLYIWKNHIILLRNDRGFYKWTYNI